MTTKGLRSLLLYMIVHVVTNDRRWSISRNIIIHLTFTSSSILIAGAAAAAYDNNDDELPTSSSSSSPSSVILSKNDIGHRRRQQQTHEKQQGQSIPSFLNSATSSAIAKAAAAAAKVVSQRNAKPTTVTRPAPPLLKHQILKKRSPIIPSKPSKTPTVARTPSSSSSSSSSTNICSARDDVVFQSDILLTFVGHPGAITESDITSLSRLLRQAYQQVANCGGGIRNNSSTGGAFLTLEQVNISTSTLNTTIFGSVAAAVTANLTQTFTLFATTKGICRGCHTMNNTSTMSSTFFLVQSDGVFLNVTTNSSSARRHLETIRSPPTSTTRSRSSSSSGVDAFHHAKTPPLAGTPKISISETYAKCPLFFEETTSTYSQAAYDCAIPRTPPPASPCTCSVPFKTAWINAVNELLLLSSQNAARSGTAGSNETGAVISTLVDVLQLEVVPCSPSETSFSTYLSVAFGSGSSSLASSSEVAGQLQLLGDIIVDSYNEAATTSSIGGCDLNFLALVNATVLASPLLGNAGGSRLLRDLATSKTTTSTRTNKTSASKTVGTAILTVFKVSGKCRGCSSTVKLFNDVSARRRRRRMMLLHQDFTGVWVDDMDTAFTASFDEHQLDILNSSSSRLRRRRRLPIIDNQCYCPANTTTTSTTTSSATTHRYLGSSSGRLTLSQFLQVLNQQVSALSDAGLITIVGPVQGTSQQSPTNCTNSFTNFTTTVTVILMQVVGSFNTSFTPDQQQFLEVSLQNAYNLLNDGSYCDPFFRRITSVTLVTVEVAGRRRRQMVNAVTHSDQYHRLVPQSSDLVVVFDCQAECRGCPSGSGLFDNGSSSSRQRRRVQYDAEVGRAFSGDDDDDGTPSLMDHMEAIKSPFKDIIPRRLQTSNETVPCLCSATSISNSAPSLGAFLVAYNATIGPNFALATHSNITISPTIMPSQMPSPWPTILPSASPTNIPTSIPTGAPTESPTMSPSSRPTLSTTLSPTNKPSNQPSLSPSARPSLKPSSQPSLSPSSVPSHKPSDRPSQVPTAVPSVVATDVPSPKPTVTQTAKPTNQQATSPPTTLQPSDVPTPGPTVQPTLAPTGKPTSSPTAGPTATPTSAPTSQPTFAPTAFSLPTSPPSPTPTSLPATSPPTSLPTSLPTAGPVLLPTAMPTSPPTSLPTNPPTIGPTLSLTSSPTAPPTSLPTSPPTVGPTSLPTSPPSTSPTSLPTSPPTVGPTSTSPTSLPTSPPTFGLTSSPTPPSTASPTSLPTNPPTFGPTSSPTPSPTASPTSLPTNPPTFGPSVLTTAPTSLPTNSPTAGSTLPPTSSPPPPPLQTPAYSPTSMPSTGLTCKYAGAVCTTAQDCCSGCCSDVNRCGIYIGYYGGDITNPSWSRTPGCFYGGCYGGSCQLTSPQSSSASCNDAGSQCSQNSDCCLNNCRNGTCGTHFWNFDLFSDPIGCADTTQPNYIGSCTRLTCLPAAAVCNASQYCCSGCCGNDNRCGVYIDYYGGDLVNGTWSSMPGCFPGNCYGGACPIPSPQLPSNVTGCSSSGTLCSSDSACCSGKCCAGVCGVLFADTNFCFDYPRSCADTRQPYDVGTCAAL